MTLPEEDGSRCKDHNKPHILWYMLEDPNDPVPAPYSLTYDTQQDALDTARVLIDKTISHPQRSALLWLKVFRADNEAYTCFIWHRPEHLVKPPRRPAQTNDLEEGRCAGRSKWKRLLGR